MKVSWDYDIPNIWKKMFQTTNQFMIVSGYFHGYEWLFSWLKSSHFYGESQSVSG